MLTSVYVYLLDQRNTIITVYFILTRAHEKKNIYCGDDCQLLYLSFLNSTAQTYRK